MTIREIYEQYDMMPNLRAHQLRVAAVARLIAEHFEMELKTPNIVSACLLHDMGNIIKSDLTTFPEFVEPQGLGYWQEAKQRFMEKYGNEEHVATYAIAKETGVSEETQRYLENMSSSKVKASLQDADFEIKICCYADNRVGPHGILSLKERLGDLMVRYPHKNYPERLEYLLVLEKQIFAHCSIFPDDINDASARGLIRHLEGFSVV